MHTCVWSKKRERHAQWVQLLLTHGASWWHNNGVGEINTQHREKDSRGVEQRDRKIRMKIRNGWGGVGFSSMKFRVGGGGWSSVTKCRWWHGPQGNSTLATSGGWLTDAKKPLAERFTCDILFMSRRDTHSHCFFLTLPGSVSCSWNKPLQEQV